MAPTTLKGREVYEKLEEALLALPEKRLIAGAMYDWRSCYCAEGALAAHCGVEFNSDISWEIDDRGLYFFTREPGTINMVVEELLIIENGKEIFQINDRFMGTPSERYDYMLAWTRERLAEMK